MVQFLGGRSIDAHTYLQKFIHLETSIPKRIENDKINDLSKYSRQLFKLHELQTWGDEHQIIECIDFLATYFRLSLRQLEKVYTNLSVFYGAIAENHFRIPLLLVFISIVKVLDPKLFDKLHNQSITYSELCAAIGINPNTENPANINLKYLLMGLQFALFTDDEFKDLNEEFKNSYFQGLWRYHLNRKQIIPIFTSILTVFTANF
jgi:hypothetical protein